MAKMLRSQVSEFDPLGEGTRQEQQQRAEAILEFTQRAKNTPKAKIHKLREEIVDRYMKRRAADNPLAAYNGRIHYETPQQTVKGYREGKLTIEQLKVHNHYFRLLRLQQQKAQQRAKPTK
jgi:hypothetical protein